MNANKRLFNANKCNCFFFFVSPKSAMETTRTWWCRIWCSPVTRRPTMTIWRRRLLRWTIRSLRYPLEIARFLQRLAWSSRPLVSRLPFNSSSNSTWSQRDVPTVITSKICTRARITLIMRMASARNDRIWAISSSSREFPSKWILAWSYPFSIRPRMCRWTVRLIRL